MFAVKSAQTSAEARRMRRGTCLGLILLLSSSVACGSSDPSITAVKCGRLESAIASEDDEAVASALAAMEDVGTEADPEAIEPEVYGRLLMLKAATSEAGFRIAIDDLRGACAQASSTS